MIGIDTNVLIRYIVQDDPVQAKLATHYIENNCSNENPGFINQLVLCEVVWVLKRAYGYDKSIILKVIRQILLTVEFSIENSESSWKALKEYELGSADFSDYIIGISNKENDCEYTITFDKIASQNPNFILLR
jgi:predicted nucleic-acid-binding protein